VQTAAVAIAASCGVLWQAAAASDKAPPPVGALVNDVNAAFGASPPDTPGGGAPPSPAR
jgi:hypothetical protein